MDLSHTVWQKSTQSGLNSCVEVAQLGCEVAVRDSKNPDGPVLLFTISEWEVFLAGVRDGEFEPTRSDCRPHPSTPRRRIDDPG